MLKIYLSHETPASVSVSSCAVGFLTSLCFGLLVVRFALSYLERGNLRPFAWYCLGLGSTITVYLNFFWGN
jgi:undecaprenyl pyrophosphate phosphatase UppP